MIERLRLRNFQCHGDTKIVFDPLVTTIVGSSDVGKSAVLRALRWVAENRPGGDAFVRSGESLCSVSLWVDGRKVARRKGKGTNEYVVDGRILRAFGSDVPTPVADLLNVGDVNFQGQHDPPFWFALSAGQVSRELNAVIDLDVIDRTLSGVSSALRKARSEEDVCRGRLEDAENRLSETDWVPEMVAEHEGVEKLDRVAGKIEEACGVLEELVERASECEAHADVEIPDSRELDALLREVNGLEAEERELDALLEDAGRIEGKTAGIVAELKGLEERLERESDGTCPLCGAELKGTSL